MQVSCRILVLVMLLVLFPGVALAQQKTPEPSPTDTPFPTAGTLQATAASGLTISSPVPGQVLQGTIIIQGSSAAEGVLSAELSFAYANNPTGTWFLINAISQPVTDGSLAQWETGAITDGDYSLRLLVTFEDGSQREVIVPGLRVRNYSIIETDTPTPVTPTSTPAPGSGPVPSATATPAPRPSPSPLPTNPAEITTLNIAISVGKGALAILGLFALSGVYLLIKAIRERG